MHATILAPSNYSITLDFITNPHGLLRENGSFHSFDKFSSLRVTTNSVAAVV